MRMSEKGYEMKVRSTCKPASLFLCILIAVCSVYFWNTSRIPDLEGKIDEVGFSGFVDVLSNRAVYTIQGNDSTFKKIRLSYYNWLITNKNGMIFGVLLASLFLALFSTLRIEYLNNNSFGSVIGTVFGIPLGLCVNCAAPLIGSSLSSRSILFSLSIVFASPNLNFIILPMSLRLIPTPLLVIKVLLTLVFILFLLKFILKGEYLKETIVTKNSLFTGWSPQKKYLGGFWQLLLQSFWVIARMTVPLMFLAGIVSVVIATLFPLDSLTSFPLWTAIPIAVITTFLPVPITFDVILANHFIEAGASLFYSGIIYYGLSSYSIYTFFIVWKFISFKLALKLFCIVTMLSIICGALFSLVQSRSHDMKHASASYPQPNFFKPFLFPQPQLHNSTSSTMKKEFGEIDILKTPYHAKKQYAGSIMNLNSVGANISPPDILVFAEPEYGTVKVLSNGDLNNDLKEELLIADENHLEILFLKPDNNWLSFSLPNLPGRPLTAGFIDMDSDGDLDIIASFFFAGIFVLKNTGSTFEANWLLIEGTENRITQSLSFFDFDRNGFVDIHAANSSLALYRNFKSSVLIHQNSVILNNKNSFQIITSEQDMPGETLANLITDTNNDGFPEIVQANDFGRYSGVLKFKQDGINTIEKYNLEHVTRLVGTGMSVDSADIDLDGRLETFVTGSHFQPQELPSKHRFSTAKKVCDYWSPEHKKSCLRTLLFMEHFSPYQKILASKENCTPFHDNHIQYKQCLEIITLWNANHIEDKAKCQKLNIDLLRGICEFQMSRKTYSGTDKAARSNKIMSGKNGLYFSKKNVWDQELAEAWRVDRTCWAWGSKFADVNFDAYDDLIITNGFLGISGIPCRTLVYINNEGKSYKLGEPHEVAGASSLLVADIDFDGDLDQLLAGPFIPYIFKSSSSAKNHTSFDITVNNSTHEVIGGKIEFMLNDDKRILKEFHLGDGYSSIQSLRQYISSEKGPLTLNKFYTPDGKIYLLDMQLDSGFHYQINLNLSN